MTRRLLVAALALACTATAAADSDPPLRLITSQVRLDIAGDGRVQAAQPDPALPAAVADPIRAAALAWRFEPVLDSGQPVSGRTYAQVSVCVVAVGESLDVATQWQANGPGRDGPATPRYPVPALREGRSGDVQLTYRVDAEGQATVEDLRAIKGRVKDFSGAVEEWLAASRFQPELVAGKPVPTRMAMPIQFRSGPATTVQEVKAAQQRDERAHPACQAALAKTAAEPKAVALDSPFRRIDGA